MGTVLVLQLGCSLVKQHLKARELVLGEVEMFILMDAIMNAYRGRPWLRWGGGALCQHGFKRRTVTAAAPGAWHAELSTISWYTQMAPRTWR